MNNLYSAMLFVIFAMGCHAKQVHLNTDTAIVESLCLDGLVVNLYSSGCESIRRNVVPFTKIVKLECGTQDSENPWSTKSYYALEQGSLEAPPDGVMLMCMDPVAVVVFKETE
tara:strand:- start:117 stop:455 length:339 start_codon:yes stop_codon:yes gene_type:complete